MILGPQSPPFSILTYEYFSHSKNHSKLFYLCMQKYALASLTFYVSFAPHSKY